MNIPRRRIGRWYLRFWPLLLLPVGVGIAVLSCGSAPVRDTISLDPRVRFQTMRGWEATADVVGPCDPHMRSIRDAVVRSAVRDIGIDRLRVEVRSGAENPAPNWQRYVDSGCGEGQTPGYQTWRTLRYATVNDNADPRVIDWRGFNFAELDWHVEQVVLPFQRELAKLGRRPFINVNYVAFTKQITTGSYHHLDPAEYAEFVLATCLHLKEKYGIVPDSWEILLEPDNVPRFDGTLLGRLLVATAARLRENGFTPGFVAPSTTRMDNAVTWFDELARVPGALDHLAELSYHRYGGVSTASLRAIAARAERHHLPTAMLEWWFGNGTHQVLLEDLTVGRNSSWQGRTLGSLFVLNGWDPSRPLVPEPDVKFNRQYFRFIERGAVRIAAASATPDVQPVAFINPSGGYVVVASTSRAAELTIHGLPPGRYGITYTTEREYDVNLPPVQVSSAGSLITTIPGPGVITVWAAPGPGTSR